MASDRQTRYQERMYLHDGENEISAQAYNLVLGGTLLYGFIINCLLVYFCADAAFGIIDGNPILFFIGYAVLILVGSFMIHGSRNPSVSFIGYNFFVLPMGLILSYIINIYNAVGYSNIVTMAFGITALVTFLMMVVSSVFPNVFLNIGRVLGITLLITVLVELVMMLFGTFLPLIDYVVVLIFCGYVGYDWARANACAKTVDNAVDSAAELYVDIVNLFVRILRILARNNRN
jgi:FtsH-binding integral membrane protein